MNDLMPLTVYVHFTDKFIFGFSKAELPANTKANIDVAGEANKRIEKLILENFPSGKFPKIPNQNDHDNFNRILDAGMRMFLASPDCEALIKSEGNGCGIGFVSIGLNSRTGEILTMISAGVRESNEELEPEQVVEMMSEMTQVLDEQFSEPTWQ